MLWFGKLKYYTLYDPNRNKRTISLQIESICFHLFNVPKANIDANSDVKMEAIALQIICCPIRFHIKGIFIINTGTLLTVSKIIWWIQRRNPVFALHALLFQTDDRDGHQLLDVFHSICRNEMIHRLWLCYGNQ